MSVEFDVQWRKCCSHVDARISANERMKVFNIHDLQNFLMNSYDNFIFLFIPI